MSPTRLQIITLRRRNLTHSSRSFSKIQNADKYISSIYEQIDFNNWFWFPQGHQANETQDPRGFYQWALENKYPVGTTHPLEEAHQAAAELIKEKFNELVKKPLEQNSIRN